MKQIICSSAEFRGKIREAQATRLALPNLLLDDHYSAGGVTMPEGWAIPA